MIALEKATKPLKGDIFVPGDKSISHRSIMFGAISKGTTEVTGFLESADCLSTIDCFKKLGVEIMPRLEYCNISVPDSLSRFYEYRSTRGLLRDALIPAAFPYKPPSGSFP